MNETQAKEHLKPLIELAHHRWNIPVVAELHRRSGAKFVTLANALGVSRSSLSASLNDLIDLGLVKRNPGYGHPMRPEYLLTDSGAAIGDRCLRLVQLLDRRDEAEVGYRKWTLPLVAAVGEGVERFSDIRIALGDRATPRAIAMGLKSMLSAGWAQRLLVDDFPPSAGYALTSKGRSVFRIVDGMGC